MLCQFANSAAFCSFAVPPALVVLQSTDPLLPVPSNVAKPVSTPGFPIISHHASLINIPQSSFHQVQKNLSSQTLSNRPTKLSGKKSFLVGGFDPSEKY